LLAGPEHGRTIPLPDMSGPLLLRCTALFCYSWCVVLCLRGNP